MNKLQRVQKNKGFTLVEILVALGIFSLVMLSSTAALLTIVDINKKSQSLKSVMDNLNISLESMARALRVGKNYEGVIVPSGECGSGGYNGLKFTSQNSQEVIYSFKLDQAIGKWRIYRTINGAELPITSPDINIDCSSRFYVTGESSSDNDQPRVLLLIKGSAGFDVSTSDFTIQTTISQRVPDNGV